MIKAFLADLKNAPWNGAYVYNNVDDLWDHMTCGITGQSYTDTCRSRKKRIRVDQPPWITPQLQGEISRRNRLFKLHKKDPSQQTWEASVRIQRNKVTSLKCRGMKSFCLNASVSTKHHGEF